MLKLYEDKLNGEITSSMYKTMSEKKQEAINQLTAQIKNVELEISKLERQLHIDADKLNDIKAILNKFLNSDILNQDVVHQIINKIYVGEEGKIQVVFKIDELQLVM